MTTNLTQSAANLIPGMMSLALVGRSVQMVPKNWGPKGMKKFDSKKSTGKLIKGFTEIMIGVPLISATSGMVSKL